MQGDGDDDEDLRGHLFDGTEAGSKMGTAQAQGSTEMNVFLGKPFSNYDVDELDDLGKPMISAIAPREQSVNVDHDGHHFHGAFTGGFSAGYFNGVGSKEGWEPAKFRSSRSERSAHVSQTVEDFMDAEDRRLQVEKTGPLELRDEFRPIRERESTVGARGGVAAVHTSFRSEIAVVDDSARSGEESAFSDEQRTAAEPFEKLLRGLVGDLCERGKTTPGRRILKAMGWREGTTVGSRRRLRMKLLENSQALAATRNTPGGGAGLPLDSSSTSDLRELQDEHRVVLGPKDDATGDSQAAEAKSASVKIEHSVGASSASSAAAVNKSGLARRGPQLPPHLEKLRQSFRRQSGNATAPSVAELLQFGETKGPEGASCSGRTIAVATWRRELEGEMRATLFRELREKEDQEHYRSLFVAKMDTSCVGFRPNRSLFDLFCVEGRSKLAPRHKGSGSQMQQGTRSGKERSQLAGSRERPRDSSNKGESGAVCEERHRVLISRGRSSDDGFSYAQLGTSILEETDYWENVFLGEGDIYSHTVVEDSDQDASVTSASPSAKGSETESRQELAPQEMDEPSSVDSASKAPRGFVAAQRSPTSSSSFPGLTAFQVPSWFDGRHSATLEERGAAATKQLKTLLFHFHGHSSLESAPKSSRTVERRGALLLENNAQSNAMCQSATSGDEYKSAGLETRSDSRQPAEATATATSSSSNAPQPNCSAASPGQTLSAEVKEKFLGQLFGHRKFVAASSGSAEEAVSTERIFQPGRHDVSSSISLSKGALAVGEGERGLQNGDSRDRMSHRRRSISRSHRNWKPNCLLCKRWGVADPWEFKEFVDDSQKPGPPSFDESFLDALARIAERVSTPTGRAEIACEVEAAASQPQISTPGTAAAVEAIRAFGAAKAPTNSQGEVTRRRWDQKLQHDLPSKGDLPPVPSSTSQSQKQQKVTTLKLVLEDLSDVTPTTRPPMKLFKEIFGDDSDG